MKLWHLSENISSNQYDSLLKLAMKRPLETWILVALLVMLAINALYGGVSLMLVPDGSLLSMEPGWLSNSPFSNYFIPGLLLLIFNGILPLLTIYGLMTRNKTWFSWLNIYPNRCWGWTFALYCGVITNIWIIVQQLMAEYFILQTIIAALGLLVLISALLPRIMNFYEL
jgi:hypothetical protein